MEIEFYWIESGEVIEDTYYHYFVMNDIVFCDNGWCTESQEAVVSFDDFVKECPDIAWRVK